MVRRLDPSDGLICRLPLHAKDFKNFKGKEAERARAQSARTRSFSVEKHEPLRRGKRCSLRPGWVDLVFTLPCTLLSMGLLAAIYVATFTWFLQFSGVRVFRDYNRWFLTFIVAHLVLMKTLHAKHFSRAKVVFVVYCPDRMWSDLAGMYRNVRWFWAERNLVIGDLSWGKRQIGHIVLVPTITRLGKDPKMIEKHVQAVHDTFPSATIALAGQLPAICCRDGIQAIENRRIVNGRVGTVALARKGAISGLEWILNNAPTPLGDKKRTLCVLGGGGYTGSEISGACKDLFSEIYLLDSKFGHGKSVDRDGAGAAVIRTSDPACVRKADVVLVFLPKGDLIQPYIPYAHKEQVWIDDTHPPISKGTRASLCKVSNLFRLTARSKEMGMWPPLPNWKPTDLPGCLLMAVVIALSKKTFSGKASLADAEIGEDIKSIGEFIKLAEEMDIELGIFPTEKEETFKCLNVRMIPE
ncbi:hypothetical protein BSKO_05395 [Bryopsis sp. KO-2023]|nr:hypothetical protein BSKO_05395 [Bryopsis sp. KO-2023]